MDVTMQINDRAMLVRLKISQWGARKCDAHATEDVIKAHGARLKSGRFNKVLVDLDCVKAYQRAANDARTFHYAQTLPWGDDGARILPSENFIPYTKKMRELQAAFTSAADEFMTLYPDLILKAKDSLGGLFNALDYPSAQRVRSAFDFATEILPIPAKDDFRVNLAADEVAQIQGEIERRVNEALQAAVKDLWARLHKAIGHMADKLKDKDSIFRDSLIGNIRDLCEVLPRLNVTKDQDLARVIDQAKADLATMDPEGLRNSEIDRTEAAVKAEDILKKMAAYMGA